MTEQELIAAYRKMQADVRAYEDAGRWDDPEPPGMTPAELAGMYIVIRGGLLNACATMLHILLDESWYFDDATRHDLRQAAVLLAAAAGPPRQVG